MYGSKTDNEENRQGNVHRQATIKGCRGPPDGVYNIYISEVGYTTSVPQRKLFWMWMGCLEYETGTERKKWHDYYVKKFLPPEKHGISDISSKAMHHFMEQIKADAATEYGITLPLPSDLDYNDFILEYKYR